MRSALLLFWLSAAVGPALAAAPHGSKGGGSPAVENKPCTVTTEEIIGSYGRFWGQISIEQGIGAEESQVIKDKLLGLHVCQAVSSKNPARCAQLGSIQLGNVEGKEPLSARCERELYKFSFDDFLVGKSVALESCEAFIRALGMDRGVRVPAGTICGAIQNRNRPVCSLFDSRGWGSDRCRVDLPASAADCQGNAQCLERFRLYTAVTGRNAKGCPQFLRYACRFFIEGKPDECALAETDLKRTYCRLYAKAEARLGAQMGMDEEQRKSVEKFNEDLRKRMGSQE